MMYKNIEKDLLIKMKLKEKRPLTSGQGAFCHFY
jgi:hypothetical protein